MHSSIRTQISTYLARPVHHPCVAIRRQSPSAKGEASLTQTASRISTVAGHAIAAFLRCGSPTIPKFSLRLRIDGRVSLHYLIRRRFPVPALVGLIVTRDATFAEAGCGVRMVGRIDTVSEQAHWQLGSITKTFTATLAAILVERGKLMGLPAISVWIRFACNTWARRNLIDVKGCTRRA
jgi:CubicO group peptidase (beta-lactamase class C family)